MADHVPPRKPRRPDTTGMTPAQAQRAVDRWLAAVEIVELEAATIPSALPDVAIGVINANYALGAGLTTDDAIAYESEDSEAAETYVNVIVVNAGNENSEKTQALVKAIQTEEVSNFILEKYNGAVQPKF